MLASSLQDLDLHSDKEWQHILTQPSLALETLLTLETEYSMKHYVYIEIVLQWVIGRSVCYTCEGHHYLICIDGGVI